MGMLNISMLFLIPITMAARQRYNASRFKDTKQKFISRIHLKAKDANDELNLFTATLNPDELESMADPLDVFEATADVQAFKRAFSLEYHRRLDSLFQTLLHQEEQISAIEDPLALASLECHVYFYEMYLQKMYFDSTANGYARLKTFPVGNEAQQPRSQSSQAYIDATKENITIMNFFLKIYRSLIITLLQPGNQTSSNINRLCKNFEFMLLMIEYLRAKVAETFKGIARGIYLIESLTNTISAEPMENKKLILMAHRSKTRSLLVLKSIELYKLQTIQYDLYHNLSPINSHIRNIDRVYKAYEEFHASRYPDNLFSSDDIEEHETVFYIPVGIMEDIESIPMSGVILYGHSETIKHCTLIEPSSPKVTGLPPPPPPPDAHRHPGLPQLHLG